MKKILLSSLSAPVLFIAGIIFIAVLVGALVSHHGLLDLRKFKRDVDAASARVSVLEEENRLLKIRLDVLDEHAHEVLERQIRENLGWVKPDELVYVETDKKVPTVSFKKSKSK